MKNIRSILAVALAAAAFLTLPACSHVGTTSVPTAAATPVISTGTTPAATPAISKVSVVETDLAEVLAKIKAVGGDAISDAKSPAGLKLAGIVAAGSLTVAADVAMQNDAGAVLAGANAIGGALEAYSELPTTSTQLASITASASGVEADATQLAPAVSKIIAAATAKGANATSIIQAAASGVYALNNTVAH